ncbi:MAG: TlyA family RNA methyltransferase [Coriobacteriales bacterium]|jgi:23S rRNA (cytidine1920-2'-O)/16S rRNA (cytidine1409-2'-O)-methyltransferase|nr:TlyA family RNA methyltransferase [Coriobacteriales bacterium]
MDKSRLDELLVVRGLAASTDEARRAVYAGRVRSGTAVLRHPGAPTDTSAPLEIVAPRRYVSRGGLKLEAALAAFGLSPDGWRCIDVGASTGGFTDCLLAAGAEEVCAVDVGYGQFDWSLRNDARVRLFERTNIAKVSVTALGGPFDLAVVDVSFTGLARLAPVLEALVAPQGSLVALVKPQFELPRHLVKNGLINDRELHAQAVTAVMEKLARGHLVTRGLTYSPLRGARGNTEFLLWAQEGGIPATISIEDVVREAQANLGS